MFNAMEKQFENFIKLVITEWHKSGGGELLTFPEFKEIVLESKSTFKIGMQGENFIKELAESKNYIVIPSPGSKSPSDIWCLSLNRISDCYHLGLIQVKNTEESLRPETLNDDAIVKFRKFSAFVLKYWSDSDFVKSYSQYDRIIISTGYAGVITQNEYRKLFNPRYYNFWYPTESEAQLWQIKDLVEKFHYLK